MSAGQEVKLDIAGVTAQSIRKAARDFGREELVLRTCDMKNRRRDGVVLALFPILGDAPANGDDSAGFLRVGSDEAVVQAYGLRETHQQGAVRWNREAFPKLRRDGAQDVVMQTDVKIRMRARAPVIGDPIRHGTRGEILLIRRPQAGDDRILADGGRREPQHGFRVGAETVQRNHQHGAMVHARRQVQQVGYFETDGDRFQILIIIRRPVPIGQTDSVE